MTKTFFDNYFDRIFNCTCSIDDNILINISSLIWRINKTGKKLIIAGNGGSAAMASHVAVDFTKAANIRAINFNEADLITCFANDYGYENWLTEGLRAYSDEGDLVILISSSGSSPNIINAANFCAKESLNLVTLSGFASDNPLRKKGDFNLWANSSEYNVVEMTHHLWLLSIIDYLIEIHGTEK